MPGETNPAVIRWGTMQGQGEELRKLRTYFKALGDVARLQILRHLAHTPELSVSGLARLLHLSQPLVSWHLRRLERVGLIRVRKEGRQRYYSLDWQRLRAYQEEFARLIGEGGDRGVTWPDE